MPFSVLVIDDEEGIRESLKGILEDEGYEVFLAGSGEEGLRIFEEQDPDLVMLDIWLPGIDGMEVLRVMRDTKPDIPVVMISGHGTIEIAVKATKIGAYDFLEKPLSLDRVLITLKRAIEFKNLERERRELRENISLKWRLIGESEIIKRLRSEIESIAMTNSVVLITGESGSGKELVARMIHEVSPRKRGPFVEVNCAAIPGELIESELFGHEKGSFTGAIERKKGKFELADGGTLFLDEIGDMSLTAQAKVLRVIETKEFQRVGGSKNIKVDTRIISATNKDLYEEVKKGNFREDLYYRINVVPVNVPPLRDRKDDIPLLVEHFTGLISGEYGIKKKRFDSGALRLLMEYHWPGNVRELKNTVERLMIMVRDDVIKEVDVRKVLTARTDYTSYTTLKEAREAFEKDFILKKLEENNWNISKTAENIGIDRTNFYRKLKYYNIKY